MQTRSGRVIRPLLEPDADDFFLIPQAEEFSRRAIVCDRRARDFLHVDLTMEQFFQQMRWNEEGKLACRLGGHGQIDLLAVALLHVDTKIFRFHKRISFLGYEA